MGTRLRLRGGVAALIGGTLLVVGAAGVRAVIFKSTGDLTYNTNAPAGSLTNSGWQYEGSWGSFLGTPIAPRYFIAAKHVGGTIGQAFTLNGFSYNTVANYPDPNSDLQIWQVAETFPIYAPLFTNSNEVGKHCVVFGRGTQRGDPVIVDKTNGWGWGGSDGVKRWGENDIRTNVNGGGSLGQLLYATFDRSAGSNECHLSVGDSSGGMFITNGGVWKLAGIHYAVDEPFISTNGVNGSGFNAAMLDYGGVYIGGDGNWQLITNQMTDIPSGFYSTRISANVAWINSVIDFLPGDDLRITAIEQVGNDVSVSFATTNRLYYVQRADDLPGGVWTTFTNNVPGTGGIVSVLDTNAVNLPQRFYRVGLVY
jgi:hypothetical protein